MRVLFGFCLFVALSAAQIHACALCQAYIPNVLVSIDFKRNDKHISLIFQWQFEREFTQTLLHSYDINANNVLDKSELKLIKNALTSYALPRHNLTQILLENPNNENLESVKFRIKNTEIFMQDERLIYRYEVALNSDFGKSKRLFVQVQDEGDFFAFKFLPHTRIDFGGQVLLGNENANLIIFEIKNAGDLVEDLRGDFSENVRGDLSNDLRGDFSQTQSRETQSRDLDFSQNLSTHSSLQSINDSTQAFLSALWQNIIALNAKILSAIKSHIIGEKSIFGIFSLIALSLLYGVLHAAAPGHAKLLTSSYFLAHKGSYAKAFGFALRVGIVHIVSAFVLVGLGLFVLKIVVQSLANDANAIITQISSAIIIAVALALLVRKMRGKHAHTCGCASCQNHATTSNALHKSSAQNPRSIFANAPHSYSMLANALKAMQFTFSKIATNISPNIDFAKWGVIIAAGIVPCPSMILVLLLCFEVGFFSAFLSAICIAIGMSAVVFASAIFAHKVRLSAGSEKILRALEYLALCGMLCVGIFMFANAKSSVF
ncbi:nickel/cobalt transporter [Helicobacter sp. T3_23-1056]